MQNSAIRKSLFKKAQSGYQNQPQHRYAAAASLPIAMTTAGVGGGTLNSS